MGLQLSLIYYDIERSVEHYYLCNYRPLHDGADRLSRSLLRFKEALSYDLQAWIDCAVTALQELHIPDDVIIIRALSSKETGIDDTSNTALDKLGKAIAGAFHAHWMPQLIRKPKYIRPVKFLSGKERKIELKQAYYLPRDYFDFSNKRILLIDDIVTTGTTTISIIRLIKKYFPESRFKIFTLAKAGYGETSNDSLQLTGNTYDWQDRSCWIVAEDEMSYYSYAQLTACILNDDFRNI